MKQDIRNITFAELLSFVESKKQANYRAKQIWEWLWNKDIDGWEQMKNIPKDLLKTLKDSFELSTIKISQTIQSKDDTIKILFSLADGTKVESVLIFSKDRITACISTQTACQVGCKFCATANIWVQKKQVLRNLTAGEIFQQVNKLNSFVISNYEKRLSNIVVMGMGEPLMNIENTITAIQRITDKEFLNFSPSRITISTIGIVNKIKQLADANIKTNLAISLHSANQEKREKIIPIASKNNLKELQKVIKYYYEKTKNRITYEYLLLKNINDTKQDAMDFAEFCKISPCKINLIEYNKTDNKFFEKSTKISMDNFAEFLMSKNLIVNIRKNRGQDINAACGQLALKK